MATRLLAVLTPAMIKKTLYFGNPAYLSLKQGQMIIKLPEVELSQSVSSLFKDTHTISRPIEDIGIVILDNRQITLTSGLLTALLENECAVVSCNDKSMPHGMFLPLSGNTLQNERFRHQIDASLPLKKQLWQQTIKAKIRNQALVLEDCLGERMKCMFVWAENVKSGDSENLEARAAAFYWKHLFRDIPNFVRDREGISPNHLLNFGYAILRAIVARGLVISGLLPTLGIHHHNKYNAYCLADDIMEPYRPFVDKIVFDMVRKSSYDVELTKEVKAQLLTLPTTEVIIGNKRSPLQIAVSQTTASLSKCFIGEINKLAYPTYQNESV